MSKNEPITAIVLEPNPVEIGPADEWTYTLLVEYSGGMVRKQTGVVPVGERNDPLKYDSRSVAPGTEVHGILKPDGRESWDIKEMIADAPCDPPPTPGESGVEAGTIITTGVGVVVAARNEGDT